VDLMGQNERGLAVVFRYRHRLDAYINGEFTRQGDKEMTEVFPIIAEGVALRLQIQGYDVRSAAFMIPENLDPIPGALDFVKITPMKGRGFTVTLEEIDAE